MANQAIRVNRGRNIVSRDLETNKLKVVIKGTNSDESLLTISLPIKIGNDGVYYKQVETPDGEIETIPLGEIEFKIGSTGIANTDSDALVSFVTEQDIIYCMVKIPVIGKKKEHAQFM